MSTTFLLSKNIASEELWKIVFYKNMSFTGHNGDLCTQGLKLNSCLIDFSLYLELLISKKIHMSIHCLIFQIKVWKTTLCFLRSKKKTRYFILNPTWKAFFTTEVQQIVHYTKIFIKTEEKKSFINSSLIAIQIKNNLWLIKDNQSKVEDIFFFSLQKRL